MTALLSTSLPSHTPKRGKVRDVYTFDETVLIVATDRISAFDVVMENGIPDKGRILNQMSAYWFSRLSSVCPNHVLTTEDSAIFNLIGPQEDSWRGRMTLAKKTKPLAIECVARGYISGSLLKEYKRHGGSVHGLNLPDGLRESDKLDAPIFTPATKAESGHDENISFARACDIVGSEVAHLVRDLTMELYAQGCKRAEEVGLILADTKFEFGVCDEGILWIDEALTPDSSRYWDVSTYRSGVAQPSYDKQFVRDYLETLGWNKQPPGPRLPEQVVLQTRAKYLEALERVSGESLVISP